MHFVTSVNRHFVTSVVLYIYKIHNNKLIDELKGELIMTKRESDLLATRIDIALDDFLSASTTIATANGGNLNQLEFEKEKAFAVLIALISFRTSLTILNAEEK